jgi:seryl-tRNA synthetase
MVDFTRAAKISGSRHTIFINDGAKLIRVLRDFTLDCHVKNKYMELLPPVLINENILFGTGHLPKSKDDMFQLTNNQFLSPTEEVPLTGYYNNEIIEQKKLPIFLTSSTLSFRSEAGSAGKDIRGIIRQHQFYNTEMVIISKPEESFKMLELMTSHCENVLQQLEIPYRVIELCTGDIGTAACKTYDVEVWFASANQYREISSCSNCTDYQARSSLIRYRDENNKTNYVHTLNGTGTSLNRL